MASGGGGFRGGRVVGDYMIGRRIGSGSYSDVWLARHRVNGVEVAVKEIVMGSLSKKLQESLLSEIVILKRIKHPNIIALHDIIEASGSVYLILEYCRGGDLAQFIQNHGKFSEATAKHFMQQLASGLYILRENNLIHRDLKPQNLLLSTCNENSVLKIADFGFARSLQPRGLAETLCGSPLYMAPEIMQLQKYDAKADLWSVGIILFQLVIGKTPFTGNNQMQLLQNIVKSNDIQFPPENNLSHDCIDLCKKLLRRNPVERVSFEEFFNHPFLLQQKPDELISQSLSVSPADFSHKRSSGGGFQGCLPFPSDDESGEHYGSPLATVDSSPVRPTYGFSVAVHKSPPNSSKVSALSKPSSINKLETSYGHDSCRHQSVNTKVTSLAAIGAKHDPRIVDSLDLVDQDYVIVSRSSLEMSSSSLSLSDSRNSTCKSDNSLAASRNSALSAPMPIVGGQINKIHTMKNLEGHSYAEEESMDLGDTIEQPSADCMTRIKLLQQYAFVMTELVKEELENGRRLEAFSIQLVILAILKQSLHLCLVQAVIAAEGSPSETTKSPQSDKASPSSKHCFTSCDSPLPFSVSSEVEKEFILSVEHAEELAKDIGQVDEATDMPDAIELIFESALAFGRRGAVGEMMKNMEMAEVWYSKAVNLLHFLLVEAPCLNLNPPVCFTASDRQRLRTYIDVLNSRSCRFRLQRMDLKV